MKRLALHDRDTIVDLLTERLAFERVSAGLYEALLTRLLADGSLLAQRTVGRLARVRFEEHEHGLWLEGQLEALGADPEAETPRSELARRESAGLVSVIEDPARPIGHVFHALLGAELIDHAGWNALINLAAEANDREAQTALRRRLDEENEHLHLVRTITFALARREILGVDTDVARKAA